MIHHHKATTAQSWYVLPGGVWGTLGKSNQSVCGEGNKMLVVGVGFGTVHDYG